MFRLVLRPMARVPVSDSFLARRTAGPGISATCYFQISPDVALAALHSRMELLQLKHIEQALKQRCRLPALHFKATISECVFAPLQLSSQRSTYSTLSFHHPILDAILADQDRQLDEIGKIFGKRRTALELLGQLPRRSQIRSSKADLERIFIVAVPHAKEFATARLLHNSPDADQPFWETFGLAPKDWRGFTSVLLEEAFSKEFVKSTLETLDKDGFALEVTHPGVSKLVATVFASQGHEEVLLPLSKVTKCVPNNQKERSRRTAVVKLQEILNAQPRLQLSQLQRLRKHEKTARTYSDFVTTQTSTGGWLTRSTSRSSSGWRE